MIAFRTRYFIISLLLLFVEVLIALYVHDSFIRPYVGDFLVVIFLYCFIRSFLKAAVVPAATGVLLFSFIVKASQYFHFIALIGLEHSTLAQLILGNAFAWSDFVAYALGTGCVLMAEQVRK